MRLDTSRSYGELKPPLGRANFVQIGEDGRVRYFDESESDLTGERATLPSCLNENDLETLCRVASDTPEGAIVEIGVYKGGSAEHLWRNVCKPQGRDLYLYDTFEGMPVSGEHDGYQVGDLVYSDIQTIRAAIPQANVLKGTFPDSLINMTPIAFVHSDVDQYDSTLAVCRYMPPLMVKGGKILFDDYGTGFTPGCTKAVNEVFSDIQILDNGRALVTI